MCKDDEKEAFNHDFSLELNCGYDLNAITNYRK